MQHRVLSSMFSGVCALVLVLGSLTASANSIGTDAQNFNATPDGMDFVTVQSSSVLEPGFGNFGFFIHYSVNTLPYFNLGGTTNPQKTKVNDSMIAGDINLALGVARDLEIGISLPYLFQQTVDDRINVGRYEQRGNTEIRPSAKYRLIENKGEEQPWGLAVVGSFNYNRIENNPYVGEDGGLTYNLELALDRAFGKYKTALNIGHRWRSPGEPIAGIDIEPLPDQFVASAAVSYYIESWDSKLIGEIFGSYPSKKSGNFTDRELSSMEALVGIKYDWTTALAVHGGLGTELMEGTATPDYRIYAGLNYAFGPIWPWNEEAGEIETYRDAKTPYENIRMQNLRFVFNSTELTEQSKKTIEKVVAYLNSYKDIQRIIVEGHTDSVGKPAYNLDLSQRRADAVRVILQKRIRFKGLQWDSIGYGMERPLFDNSNPQGRDKNRRVELRVRGQR